MGTPPHTDSAGAGADEEKSHEQKSQKELLPCVFFTKLPKRQASKEAVVAFCEEFGTVDNVLVFYGRGMALVQFKQLASADRMLAHFANNKPVVFAGKRVGLQRGSQTIDNEAAAAHEEKAALATAKADAARREKAAEVEAATRSKQQKLVANVHGGETSAFGNFHSYYSFNPPDERLQYLPASMGETVWAVAQSSQEALSILDVGCNEGDLTIGLAGMLAASGARVRAFGVDIDTALIRGASAKTKHLDDFSFTAMSLMDPGALQTIRAWLPPGQARFDVVSMFSVTMWIHLHHGDAGLRAFLSGLCSIANNIIIEPQPWKCYRSCRNRWRRNGLPAPPKMAELEWRSGVEDLIIQYLTDELGFGLAGPADEVTRWGRRVLWLTKKQTP